MSRPYSTHSSRSMTEAGSSGGAVYFHHPPAGMRAAHEGGEEAGGAAMYPEEAARGADEAELSSGSGPHHHDHHHQPQPQQQHPYVVPTDDRPDYVEKRMSRSLSGSTSPSTRAQPAQAPRADHVSGAERDAVAPGKGKREETGEAACEPHSGRADTDTAAPTKADEEDEEEARFNEVERRARIALEAIAVRDDDVEANMPHYVSALREYRIACEARQMYREAHLVQQVLRNLRLEEETRHVRGLTEQQMEERRALEEAHREEFRVFHRSWNSKIDEFEEAQLEMEITLLERQNDELLRFHEEMRHFDPRGIPRFSRALLAVRQRQQALARQKNYAAAQEEKVKGDAIEMGDMDNYEATRAQMYERREYALRYQHQQELLALRLKVEGRRLLLEKARKRELDEVLQRYVNARNEMETQQNIIRNKTGSLLLKHACNSKTDSSGSAALVESAYSGTFGSVVQRRAVADREQQQQQRTLKDRSQPGSSGASVDNGGGGGGNGSGAPAKGAAGTMAGTQPGQRAMSSSSSAHHSGAPDAQRHGPVPSSLEELDGTVPPLMEEL